jgi:hypothetical protein
MVQPDRTWGLSEATTLLLIIGTTGQDIEDVTKMGPLKTSRVIRARDIYSVCLVR